MKLQHILNITLWMAAPLVAAVEIPDAPARLERSHIPQSDWNSFHALLAACRDGDDAFACHGDTSFSTVIKISIAYFPVLCYNISNSN